MSFTEVEITGEFRDASNKRLNGVVEATLSGAMQNGIFTIEPKVVKAKIVNGVLNMELFATDDEGTRPENLFYTFKITIQGGLQEEFKAPVPSANEVINFTDLRELSGTVGTPFYSRPELSAFSSMQAIVEALGFLQLVRINPPVGGKNPMNPQLTGPQGPEGPPGPEGESNVPGEWASPSFPEAIEQFGSVGEALQSRAENNGDTQRFRGAIRVKEGHEIKTGDLLFTLAVGPSYKRYVACLFIKNSDEEPDHTYPVAIDIATNGQVTYAAETTLHAKDLIYLDGVTFTT